MTLEDLYRLLRAGHEQAQGVVDTITEPLVVLNDALCVMSANPAFYRTFKTSRDETIGHELFKLGGGHWFSPELETLLNDVIPKSAAVVGYEVTNEFPGLGRRTMLLTARRLVHPDNNSLQMLVVFEDVTDARNRQAGQELLIGELRHRLKNLLAVAGSLARQMPVDGATAEEFRDAFLGRLEMLVEAEFLLLKSEGARLSALLHTALGQYGDRVAVAPGPAVNLSKEQAGSIGMIFHELATNAAKYGALSVPAGRVHVGWSLEGGKSPLVIGWREEGGPAVAPPSKANFGLRLIRYAAQSDLGGSVDMNFAPGGLEAKLKVPIPS